METVRTNSLRAWVLAARPKTLTAAVIPVMVATSIAVRDERFSVVPALACALFACLMQIAANFINDWFDFRKGTDREDRLGPERACAQGWISPKAMLAGVVVSVVLACLFGCVLLLYGGWWLLLVGAACVLFAFLYTTCLSYNGWGDVLVLVFFGLVPVCGTYYVQAAAVTPDVLVASVACGVVIDTLLVVNNYRDRETDAKSGKRTVVVRFGEPFGRYLYLVLGTAASLLCLWFLSGGSFCAALFPLLYLLLHVRTWRRMVRIGQGKKLNSILGETSRNMLFFGILLSLGMLFG